MRVSVRKPLLKIDDYLDLLNLAISLGDRNWQREIIRKLANLASHTAA